VPRKKPSNKVNLAKHNKHEGSLKTIKYRDSKGLTDRIEITEQFLEKECKYSFYKTQTILDADIKGCFDNISQDWLIKNVPKPLGYERLLV
jgi:hypothetical protein